MPSLKENFKQGDLIYGTESFRRAKINELKALQVSSIAFTIDTYNNVILTRVLNDKMRFELDKETAFMQWLESKEFEDENLDKEEIIKHLDAIKHVEGYPKISLINNERATKDKSRRIDKEDRKIRRACKARLAHQHTTIHFLLDSIDIIQTFDRTYSMSATRATKKAIKKCFFDSFTSTELRFIFKNYDAIKDHVKLYFNDQEVDFYDWVKNLRAVEKEAIYRWAKQKDETKIANSSLLQTIINDVSNQQSNTDGVNSNNNNISSTPSSSPVEEDSIKKRKNSDKDEGSELSPPSKQIMKNLFASFSDDVPPQTTNPSLRPVNRTMPGKKLF